MTSQETDRERDDGAMSAVPADEPNREFRFELIGGVHFVSLDHGAAPNSSIQQHG